MLTQVYNFLALASRLHCIALIAYYNFAFSYFAPQQIQTMPNAHHLHIAVVAEGPTRVLKITDSRLLTDGSEPIVVQPIAIAQSSTTTDHQQQQQQATSAIAITASVSLAGFGISVVDKRPRELLYILAGPINLNYSNTGTLTIIYDTGQL
jgi:hypothetical protein